MLVWHPLDWGWQRGQLRVGTRRRWWTVGPLTIYGRIRAR